MIELVKRLCLEVDDTFEETFNALMIAHINAAESNQNSSTSAAILAAPTQDLAKVMIAALSTTGGAHAPVTDTRKELFLFDKSFVEAKIKSKGKILGYGNSFHKGKIDPAWENFELIASKNMPDQVERIMEVYELLKAEGKDLYPNAAAFTAGFAQRYNMQILAEPMLFILPRMFVWTDALMNAR